MGLFGAIGSFFGFGNAPSVPGPSKPAGSDGVAAPSGFLVSPEANRKLIGSEKWRNYDSYMANIAIVSAAVLVRGWLLGSAKWSAAPNPKGKQGGKLGVEIVTEGMLEASMPKPWRNVIRRQGMKTLRGFALHEGILRKRKDGRLVYGEFGDRPQWSVYRWDKPDEQGSWVGIEQQTPLGGRFYIPRERLFYSVEDTTTPSPDGVGMLRYVAEYADTLTRYRQLEGIGFDGDLRGMPIGWAPLAKLKQQAIAAGIAETDTAKLRSYIEAQVSFLTTILKNYIKMPNQSLLMDSAQYTQPDEKGTIVSGKEWGFELVKSQMSAAPELRAAIGGLNADIARILGVEHMLMGDSEGARSVHEDKTAMFEVGVNATLSDLVDDAQFGPAARLIAVNGLDPETDTPKLQARIDRKAVEAAARMLQSIAAAGMPLNPASKADVAVVNTLHERSDLPPRDELDATDSMLGGGKPDPAAGEVDVAVDDLTDTLAPDQQQAQATKPKPTTTAKRPTRSKP